MQIIGLWNNTRKSPLLKINIMFAMSKKTLFRKKWTLRVCAMAHAWSHNFYIISKLLFSFILLVCFRYLLSYYRYHNSCFIIFMLILMSFKRIILIIKLHKYLISVMGNSL